MTKPTILLRLAEPLQAGILRKIHKQVGAKSCLVPAIPANNVNFATTYSVDSSGLWAPAVAHSSAARVWVEQPVPANYHY